MNGYRSTIGKALMKFKALLPNERPNMALGGIMPKQQLAMVA